MNQDLRTLWTLCIVGHNIQQAQGRINKTRHRLDGDGGGGRGAKPESTDDVVEDSSKCRVDSAPILYAAILCSPVVVVDVDAYTFVL